MKTRLIILLCLIIDISTANAQSGIVQVTGANNNIIVNFTLPAYSIKDTSLAGLYTTSETFKYIAIDGFGRMGDVGFPELPQLTFDLHVPTGSSGYVVTLSNVITETVTLNRRIIPWQDEPEEEETDPPLQLNVGYYASDGSLYGFTHQLSDPYIVFGESGIALSILPFTYNPQASRLTVLKKATFTISYTAPENSSPSPPEYVSPIATSYLSNFFQNYYPNQTTSGGTSFGGRYLMIVPPDMASALQRFAEYKRVLGYDVHVWTTPSPVSAGAILNYIYQRYYNKSTRPDFVLLVGDSDKIPASMGDASGDDKNNPITDLHYAFLDGSDYLADVFLGRWPCSTVDELNTIINKTIYMELQLPQFAKNALFVAGSEEMKGFGVRKNWKENKFNEALDFAVKNYFEPAGYFCRRLYQPSNKEYVQTAINVNHPLFFAYRGHGSAVHMAPLTFDIMSTFISESRNKAYPFVFSFACQTGNFAYKDKYGNYANIGRYWLTLERGGVTFFGASVNTNTRRNTTFAKKVIGDAVHYQQRIGEIVNLGLHYFSNELGSFVRKTDPYLKTYNLLGDPSLNTQGYDCHIEGNNVIAGSATYTLNTGWKPTRWTVSDGFQIVSGQGTNVVTVKALNPGISGTVTAIVHGVEIPKKINSLSLTISGPDVITGSCSGSYTINREVLPSNATNPRWSISDTRTSFKDNGLNGCVVTRTTGNLDWPADIILPPCGGINNPCNEIIHSSGSNEGDVMTTNNTTTLPAAQPTIYFEYSIGGTTYRISKVIQLGLRPQFDGMYNHSNNKVTFRGYTKTNYHIKGSASPASITTNYKWDRYYESTYLYLSFWFYDRGETYSGTKSPDFNFATPGTYRIDWSVQDGCPLATKSVSSTFTVMDPLPLPPINPPWIIDPLDPTNPIVPINPGIPWYGFSNVYPNPASSTLHLTVTQGEGTSTSGTSSTNSVGASQQEPAQYTIQLVSVQTGVVAYNRPIANLAAELSIDVSAVANGWYVLRLLRNNEIVQTQTILVMH